jgi:hyperosmotically inducible periplasmic protein
MKQFLKKILFISTLFFSLQSLAADITDSAIVKSIEGQIAANPITSSTHVTLSSHAGNIMLSGIVDTDQEAGTLIEIAQSTPGVTEVSTDSLKVKESTQPFADTVITAKIKGLFLRDKLFTEKEIAASRVETKNGIVYLSGTANSNQAINNAIRLAKSVKGVKKVESHLMVSSHN